jgi:hypothetical protein
VAVEGFGSAALLVVLVPVAGLDTMEAGLLLEQEEKAMIKTLIYNTIV